MESNDIFVFGSNLAGKHGRGAALSAYKLHEAIWGIGRGLQGNSYAIPTKDADLCPLGLEHIRAFVHEFIVFARKHPEMRFHVTRIGCGLAGYTDEDIAPMFHDAPTSVILPKAWGGEGFGW